MIDVREHNLQFEGKKISMVHTKRDGHVLRLAINPADAPEELFRDPVDQRYLVVMVKLGAETDEPQPVNQEGQKALNIFNALAKSEEFQMWLFRQGVLDEFGVEPTIQVLKGMIGIESRKELKTNKDSRAKLFAVRDDFAYNTRAK